MSWVGGNASWARLRTRGSAVAIATGVATGIAACVMSIQGACSSERAAATQRQDVHPINVEVIGCAMVERDGTCSLDEQRALRVWVPAPWSTDPQFYTARGKLAHTLEAQVGGGSRLRVTVPAGARSLALKSRARGRAGAFHLKVRNTQVSVALERALALRRAKDTGAAVSSLRRALPELAGAERARAESLLARMELGLGRIVEARESFARAIALDRRHQLVSAEMLDSCSLAFLMVTRLHQLEDAQALLDTARAAAMRTADGRARFPYFEGLIAFELGDLRLALSLFRTSQEHAHRLGLTVHEWTARDRVAAVLQALGRTSEAIAELEALQRSNPEGVSACERADVLINLGWHYIEHQTATARDLKHASTLLEQARAMFPRACADPFRHAVGSINLAYAAARLGDVPRARRHLTEARRARHAGHEEHEDGGLAVWWHELEGQIALTEQRPDLARAAYEKAEEVARTLLLPEMRWRALVGLGRALEGSGLPHEALRAYTDAESVLDQRTLGVPLGEGRAAFLARHDVSAQARIELTLQLRGPSRAFAVARHARARLLRALEDAARLSTLTADGRKKWLRAITGYKRARSELLDETRRARELPVDQLTRAEQANSRREAALLSRFESEVAELAVLQTVVAARSDYPGLTLLYHPLRSGWVAFASDARGTDARKFEGGFAALSQSQLAERLLTPFSAKIARASQLQVLAEAELAKLDFHALPFVQEPLIAHVKVSYPLDLPVAARSAQPRAHALVVSDPSRDLPRALAEARQVVAQLRAAGVSVDVLEGDEATTRAVTSLVGTASHIHFAGHAMFAGNDGWQSVLRLARGESMSMGDVLSTATTARTVVLSGCEAAQASDRDVAALGIASAFVLAGAQAVVAPTRTVADGDAQTLMRAAYAASQDALTADWSDALRTAQLHLRSREPTADWAAFRIITR